MNKNSLVRATYFLYVKSFLHLFLKLMDDILNLGRLGLEQVQIFSTKVLHTLLRYNLTSYLQSIDQDNNLTSNKARAHFTLSGYHFNPDDITRLLGIEPTSVDASGARSALDKPITSSWELSTETMTDNIDVYKMTDIIIKKIEPAKEKILQVIKSHNLSPRIGVILVLSIDKNESVPDVGFGARTIRFLAEIGAFINVDYQLSERI